MEPSELSPDIASPAKPYCFAGPAVLVALCVQLRQGTDGLVQVMARLEELAGIWPSLLAYLVGLFWINSGYL